MLYYLLSERSQLFTFTHTRLSLPPLPLSSHRHCSGDTLVSIIFTAVAVLTDLPTTGRAETNVAFFWLRQGMMWIVIRALTRLEVNKALQSTIYMLQGSQEVCKMWCKTAQMCSTLCACSSLCTRLLEVTGITLEGTFGAVRMNVLARLALIISMHS